MIIRFVVLFSVALFALRSERLDLVKDLSSYGKVETIEPMPDQVITAVAIIGNVLWLVDLRVTVNLLVGGSIPPAGEPFS